MYVIKQNRVRTTIAPATEDQVRNFMSQPIEVPKPKTMPGSLGELLNEVCAKHKVLPEYVLGKQRAQEVVAARQEMICHLYFKHHYPIMVIAHKMNMDHTSVKHLLGLRKASQYSHDLLRKRYA